MAIFNLRPKLAALSAWALALALAFGTALPQPAQAIGPETGGYAQMQDRDFRSLRAGVPAGIGASRTPVSIPRASVPANLPRIPAAPSAETMGAASGRFNSCITCSAVVAHPEHERQQGKKSQHELTWAANGRRYGSILGGTLGIIGTVAVGAHTMGGGGAIFGTYLIGTGVVAGELEGGRIGGNAGRAWHNTLPHHNGQLGIGRLDGGRF